MKLDKEVKYVSNFLFFFSIIWAFATTFFILGDYWSKKYGWVLVVSFILSTFIFFICGIGIRKGYEWSWWVSTCVCYLLCSLVIYGMVVDFPGFNPASLLFLLLILMLYDNKVLNFCSVSKYSCRRRIIIPLIIVVLYFLFVICRYIITGRLE